MAFAPQQRLALDLDVLKPVSLCDATLRLLNPLVDQIGVDFNVQSLELLTGLAGIHLERESGR